VVDKARTCRSRAHRWRGEVGMNTAEYAVGTVAACGSAGLLFMCQGWFADIVRAFLQFAFQEVLWWPPIMR
jgi:Protein of unknown function (DUF4244)